MPRNGSGVYSLPSGSTAVPNTPIASATQNAILADLVADLNAARPVVAGGTGATTAAGARTNLGISATNTPFTPAGTVAATNTQEAIQELDVDLQVLRDRTRATVGANNTMFGVSSIPAATTGVNNSAVGFQALQNNTTGFANSAVGVNALLSNSTGTLNTAAGVQALRDNTTGSSNSAFGVNSLLTNTTFSNCTGLGYDAQVTGSNQVQLGDGDTTTYVYGTVQNRSDARDKADIRDTRLGLRFIMRLRPVDYRWDMRDDYRTPAPQMPAMSPDDPGYSEAMAAWRADVAAWSEANRLANITHDGTHKRKRYHSGLIAQEVVEAVEEEAFDERGWGAVQDHSRSGGDDVLSLGPDQFIAPLIRAIQEQQATIAALEARIAALEA